jgi:hypothetical protein
VLDDVEERRLGPVDVVEHDDERPVACERFEELARPRRHLVCRARAWLKADGGRQAARDGFGVVGSPEMRRDAAGSLVTVELAQDLCERPQRDAGAVREAAADEHLRPVRDGGRELARQPRLADPGRPHDGLEVGASLAHRPVECAE